MPKHCQINPVRAIAIATLILIYAIACAAASTFDDYQKRVSTAAGLLEQSHNAFEDESLSDPDRLITTNVDRVRQLLPAKETVQLGRENISVNNTWLHEALAEFEKENNWTQRLELLARASERLQALSERLKDLQSAAVSSDKDADKGRLAEILRRPEYVPVAPESSALERLLARFFRWLGKLFPQTKPFQPGGSPVVSAVAQILIVGLAVAAIAFLAWRFGPRLFQGRRKKKTKREARIVLGERLEPDQTAADLLAQAEALARNGDLRAAIRKAYIALLCELGDRKIVSLAQHKTNRDYLNSVRDKSSLFENMRQLTHSFELHWYGLVPVGETEWAEFKNGYRTIVTSEVNK